jgi:hypothetical protein
VREKHSGATYKEMDMIFLNSERTSHPGVGFTDATDFLFEKRSKRAPENLLPIVRAPDKMGSKRVGDMFGVLYIHTQRYTMCSRFLEGSHRAAFPLLER